MRIDSSSNVDAFTKLADQTGQVAAEVQVSVTKQVLDVAEQSTLQLLQSLEPNLGRRVDVRA